MVIDVCMTIFDPMPHDHALTCIVCMITVSVLPTHRPACPQSYDHDSACTSP